MRIEANLLSHPDDIKAALAGVELCREIGNSQALRSFARQEVMPGNSKGVELQKLYPGRRYQLLAPERHRTDGPGCNVGGGRRTQSVRAQQSPDCGRVHYAPRDDR